MFVEDLKNDCCPTPHVQMVEDPLLEQPRTDELTPGNFFLLAIPAFFNLLATFLNMVGIIYIPASVWAMLSGAAPFFVFMFSVLTRKTEFDLFHGLGLLLGITGLVMIGYASVQQYNGLQDIGPFPQAVGVAVTLLGQVFRAASGTAKQYFLKDLHLRAVTRLGALDLWALILMIEVVFPWLWMRRGEDHGHLEDIFSTLALVKNSQAVFCMFVIQFFASGICKSIEETGVLPSVARIMLDALRTMLVWHVGLFVYYAVDNWLPFGEEWTDFSHLQLCGFVILTAGRVVLIS